MMKKKILFPILSSLFLLFGSCENNFDAHIYGDLIQGKYPSTEDEYVSYMMTCYIPFTSVFIRSTVAQDSMVSISLPGAIFVCSTLRRI